MQPEPPPNPPAVILPPARTWRYHLVTALLGAGVLGLLALLVVIGSGGGLFAEGTPVPARTARPTAAPVPRLALAELPRLLEAPGPRPVVVDVRSREAYAAGHIAGAVSIPAEELVSRLAEIPQNTLVVLYCQ
jgi:hypothetical protein